MANSRFEYVRQAELDDKLLPNTFAIVRLDGKGFTKFSQSHQFQKPNDLNALKLMNSAAIHVLESDLGRGRTGASSKTKTRSNRTKAKSFTGIFLAYGQSDEFSFAFGRNCQAYNRRASKLLTTVLSTFTAAYIHLWPKYFPQSPLSLDNLPTFDGRIIQYATHQELKDYFKWRQVDAHINNLYNTTFWALVKEGNRTTQEAHTDLKGTFSKDKHSILFDRFKINYNNELEIFKKGSILIWSSESTSNSSSLCVDSSRPDTATSGQDASTNTNTPPEEWSESSATTTLEQPSNLIEQITTPKNDSENVLQSVSIVHQDLVKDDWWDHNSLSISSLGG